MNKFQLGVFMVLASVVLSLIIVSYALAGYADNPPPLPGFIHTTFPSPDSPQHHGILLSGMPIGRSSPVIADIDGNTANGKEIAVGGADGMLYVYRSDGSLLWSKNVLPSACSTTDSMLNSSPAVGQLFGDGVPYVVIGYGTVLQSNCDGGVVAYRGSDGTERWRYSLVAASPTENLHGVISTPALADVDGSGKLVVGFGGLDRHVYLLNSDGTLRWRYNALDTVWSSPAFMDVNGDGRPEMIIGTDITANPNMIPPTSDGGYVYAFYTQPRNPTDINFGDASAYAWRDYFDQTIYSSPAIADVLPSNPGAEIVIGSGCYFPNGTTNKNGKWVKILRPSDGTVLQTLNAPACLRSSPAIGDIDDSGQLKVVATYTGATEYGGNGKSYVVAWDPVSGNQLWATAPGDANTGSNDPYGDDLQSPIIADLDGNGSLEVLVSNFWTVHVLNGKTGVPLTCQNNSTCGNQLSLFGWYTLKSTPAVGDVNGDGVLDVVIGGGHISSPGYPPGKGILYAWTNLAAAGLGSPPGKQLAYSAPWPMFRGDARRNGLFGTGVPILSVTPSSVYVLHQYGDQSPENVTLSIRNTGDGSINWTATPPGGVTVNPLSGTLSTSAQVTVTISTSGKPLGVNNLGNIVVSGTSGGNAVSGSPFSIPVTLNVVQQLFKLDLPLILR